MNEINIILDSNLELDETLSTSKNDKKILFENINKHMNILNVGKYIYNRDGLINSKLDDLIYLDSYIDFITELDISSLNTTENFENDVLHKLDTKEHNSIFSKKIIIKKMLELMQPIIDDANISNISTNINKPAIIVNKNQVMLNYPINSKYINPNLNIKELKTYIVPALNYFNLVGLYNNKVTYNVPYILNEFSLQINNLLKKNTIDDSSNLIYIKEFKYNNITRFYIENTNINNLIKLYKLVLARFELYNNNIEINDTKQTTVEEFPINFATEPEIKNKDVITYNKFLNNKIGNCLNSDDNVSINNIYNSFNNDGLLFLYEKIKLYTIDNENVKKTINTVISQKKNLLEYNNNMSILNNKILINNKLEHIAKKKFPNLFNPNHKENIFNKFNRFDINSLSSKVKDVILLDFKKNEDFIKNQLHNKCRHKELLKNFYNSENKYSYFQDLLKYINKDNNNKNIYKCVECKFNLLCPHVVDYYILTFSKNNSSKSDSRDSADFINQKILNKYMSNAPIDMIYYCKICGEELGKNADIEQNIEFKDNVRVNTLEFSDETSMTIQNSVSYIVYTYVSYKGIGMQINKKQIIKYIINLISFYINNIEKRLRKSKSYDNEKIITMLKFNIIIFTYASMIYIMNKYSNLVFNKIKKSNIFENAIVNTKTRTADKNNSEVVGSKGMNIIKERFRDAYELIIGTNYLLLTKLDYNKNSEVVKNILVKTYTIINGTGELELDTTKINNLELLFNSSIYQYYYNIANTYPLNEISNQAKRKNIDSMLNTNKNYIYTTKRILKEIKYNDYKSILGNIDIDKKPNYLFENITVPKFINNKKEIDISNIDKINNFSEYKYYSFLLFVYFIKNRLYELPIYEFIELAEDLNLSKPDKISDSLYVDTIKKNINENYKQHLDIVSTYISKLFIIKNFELTLIKNNIRFNQYPYSSIKLNNSRYFYKSKFQNINLNIYICKKDSELHKYNIYIYNLNDKEYRFVNKDIEKNLNVVNDKKSKFIGYQCSKCKLDKNAIISSSEYNNNDIYNNINDTKDIVKFYNIYRYKCPLAEFHIFDKDNTCKLCKMTSSDILNENVAIFNKFKKNYIEYTNLTIINNNNSIISSINNSKKLLELNVEKEYKQSININADNSDIDKFISYINNLNLDDLFISISNISSIHVKYFKILGLTEGIKYSDIELVEPSYVVIDNRFIKISNYIRTLAIYSSILVNINKCTKYYDFDLLEIINDIKLLNINNKLKLESNINLIDIFNYIKMTSSDNKHIIEFGLKLLFNRINEINILNKSLDNQIDKYLIFVIKKIFLSDELFTIYNYAELKQMFTENSAQYDNLYADDIDDDDETEDAGLFEYNNIDVDFGDVED